MKKFITLLIVAIALISCNTDEDDKVRNSDFVGKWNWTGTHGGFAFHIHTTTELVADSNEYNKLTN